MKSGGVAMKILKIEGGNGYFWAASSEEWLPIDKIDKDGLMKLLNAFLNEEVEADEYNEDSLSNKAQQIIYKSVSEKFNDLKKNKDKFKDESDRMYLEDIQKYSKT